MMVIICMMSFSDFSFADAGVDQKIFDVNTVIYLITSFLSWFWVILAKLAWEFLTNKWVYWEVIWLDSLLRQWRVIMKNISNFWLLFYFTYMVFSAVIWKDDIVKKVKDNLIWILVAWVWIQASWFFTAAMIDVSTITLVAAGSLPAQVISMDSDVEKSMKEALAPFVDQNFTVTTWLEYSLFPLDWTANTFIKTNEVPIDLVSVSWENARDRFIDMLLPSADDVSGPFYYIWFSILQSNILNTNNQSDEKSVKKTILNILIQWWTTVIYAIEIWVLCILALMRIIYLWMFIVLSPLAVLLRCIDKADNKVFKKIGGDDWLLWSLTKHINFKSFFINIFKPTIIFLWISLAMIFATLMSGVITKNGDKSVDEDLWWVQILSKKDKTEQNESYTIGIHSNIFSYTFRHAGKGILDLMMSILTLVIVYVIIKIAVNIWWWKDFVSEKIGKIQKSVWETLTSLPVMPVAWYDDKTGAPKTRYLNSKQIFGTWTDSIIWGKMNQIQGKIYDEYNEQTNVIDSWFKDNKIKVLESKYWKDIDDAAIRQKWIGILTAKYEKIRELGARSEGEWWLPLGYWYGMILSPGASHKEWQNKFKAWLDWMKDQTVTWTEYDLQWNEMISRWNDSENTDKTLEKMFKSNGKEKQYVKAYANLFGLNLSSNTWEQLKNADISKRW